MIEKKLRNGQIVKAYPISNSQKMMFLMSLKYGSGYPVNNIGCGYYWQGEMDEKIMKESIYEAIERCDTMRLRFTKDKKVSLNLHQYVTEKSELVIENWDYSHKTVEEAEEELTKISRQNIPMYECEVHKIAIVKFKNGYHGLFIRFHHLAMDAYSVKMFLNDVIEIYKSKTQGTAYPKPMRPYIPVLEKELEYQVSEQCEIDKKYWYDSLAKSTEPIFTDFLIDNRLKHQQENNPGQRYADIHSGLPDADIFNMSMSAEDSDKIMKLCADRNLSIFAVLSMGVRTGLSCFNDNQEDVSFKMIINRRGTIAEKKSGGLRINFLPMRSIVKPQETFCEAVQQISDVQNEMYQHASLSFMDTLKERHKSMPEDSKSDSTYDSFGLSYQPLMKSIYIDEEMEKSAKSIWYNNGSTMIPLYVTIRHRKQDNGLDFCFEYRKEPPAEYDLRILYTKIAKALVIGAENPDITVGEILDKIALTDAERNGKPECKNSHSLLKSLKTTWKSKTSLPIAILKLILK